MIEGYRPRPLTPAERFQLRQIQWSLAQRTLHELGSPRATVPFEVEPHFQDWTRINLRIKEGVATEGEEKQREYLSKLFEGMYGDSTDLVLRCWDIRSRQRFKIGTELDHPLTDGNSFDHNPEYDL